MEQHVNRLLIHAFIYVIICVVSIHALNECALCDCCKGVCQSTQNYKCDNAGCVDGYRGDQCRHKCTHSACVACRRSNKDWCTKCNAGFFVNFNNPYCTKQCNARCETCSGSATNCPTCKEGYVNIGTTRNCRYTCPTNCETCSNYDTCSGCKPGFYDVSNNCDKLCSQNCLNCTGRNYCTECKPGRYSTLQYMDCRFYCPIQCFSCTSNNNCNSCKTGYYGNTCQSTCSHGCTSRTCDKDTGTCPSCWTGYTGSRCDLCITGTFGSNCDSNCPNTCKWRTCDRYNGKCTYGCISANYVGESCENCATGRHGTNCDKSCPVNCKGSTCFRYNGTCIQGCTGNFAGETCTDCRTGMYGDQCTEICPNNCLNDICNKASGLCPACKSNYGGNKCEDCKVGYYGQSCTLTCSNGCSNRRCNRTSGVCVSGCINNYSGDKCCVHHDKGRCASCSSNTECATCDSGRYGQLCNNKCSTRCFGNECGMNNGYCNDCENNIYGLYCENDCPDNCFWNITSSLMDRICAKDTGDCLQDCKTGYFGIQCNDSCSQNCIDNVCDRSTGWCTYNCVKGFHGPDCTEAKLQRNPGEAGSVSEAAIGGGVGATLAAIVIVVVIVVVVVIRRRRLAIKKGPDTSNNIHDTETVIDQTINLSNPIYENADNVDRENVHSEMTQSNKNIQIQAADDLHEEHIENEPTPITDSHEDNVYSNTQQIAVSHLYQYVSKRTTQDFTREFQSIPNGLQCPYTVSQKPENRPKNRYKGMYPYDHSRVTVDGDKDFYMNASFIDGYSTKREYIASLGPTLTTTDKFVSFWQMVWHHKVDTIVMLTNLIEGATEKCQQYWPDNSTTVKYGDMTVTCQQENVYVEYTASRLKVSCNKEDQVVHHLHFKVWPDKSVPEDITSLVEFREKVNSIRGNGNTKGPTVVHCSAGVGRTGTYIALDKLTKEGEDTEEVNVIRCVLDMREQRVNMVQTAEQYEYLHKCLVYTLTTDCGLLTTNEISSTLQSNSEDVFTNLHEMLRLDMDNGDTDALDREKNMQLTGKNRTGSDIPGNTWRPRLFLNRGFNESDYINAVYMNSFTCNNQFIIAQTPLPETVEDFLTLVYQTNVTCIVSLDDSLQRGKDVGVYQPPENQEMKRGAFTISSEKCQSTEQYTERKLKLTFAKGTNLEEKIVRDFQFTMWPASEKVPSDAAGFVQFTKLVDNISNSLETEPHCILLHCLTGAERSGLFCAVAVLLEKLQLERHVSVLNTLRQIRLRRKTAIPNKEQIQFCYQCLAASQLEKDIYYNL